MRYFLELAFDGLPFRGWQAQPNAVTVQSQIETSLSILLRETVKITGAGRTDTGVNARRMFAHFDTELPIVDKNRFLLSLNRMVGKDISIIDIQEVNGNAHARFDAVSRTYKYFISYNKNPFIKTFSWHSPSLLDIANMNEAARILLDTRDFTSFAKLHSDVKTNICDVREAHWLPISEDKEALKFLGDFQGGIVFTITADRFLRNMVRAIVGTLVDVGRGKISIDDFRRIIDKKDRCEAGISMPPHALFLWNVEYHNI